MTDIKLDHFSKKGHQFGDESLTVECIEKKNRKQKINGVIDKVKPLSNISKGEESGDPLLPFLLLSVIKVIYLLLRHLQKIK